MRPTSSTATWSPAAAGRTCRSGRARSWPSSSGPPSRHRAMAAGVSSDPLVPTGRSIDVAGSPVRVRELGAGPPVLLLHGSGPGTTGWGAWAAVATELAARHRVVVPDQAGFGATPAPGGKRPGLCSWSAQAAGLMDALEV